MLGGSGAYASSLRKFKKNCAVWCVLVCILIRLCLEKFPKNFYIKNIYYIGTRLLWGT